MTLTCLRSHIIIVYGTREQRRLLVLLHYSPKSMGLTSTNMVTAWEWDGNAPMIVGSAVMARTEELEATIAPKSRQFKRPIAAAAPTMQRWSGRYRYRYGTDGGHGCIHLAEGVESLVCCYLGCLRTSADS